VMVQMGRGVRVSRGMMRKMSAQCGGNY